MSWQAFRCNLESPGDDCSDPLTTSCIGEALYKGQVRVPLFNLRHSSSC